MNTRIEEMLAGLKITLGRNLTDEEETSVIQWEKCKDLAQFQMSCPNEWRLICEMFESQQRDIEDQWKSLLDTHPENVRDVEIRHAIAYGSYQAIDAILVAAKNAVQVANEMPDIVKHGIQQFKAMSESQLK